MFEPTELLAKEVRRAVAPVLDEITATRESVDRAMALLERFDERLERYEQILRVLEPVLNVFRRFQGIKRQP